MLLSIITPTFNSENYIEGLLLNIIEKKIENSELLVIDNLSTDATLAIIEGFKDRIAIKVISEPDNGVYDAMNKGILNARGEWVYFMGADDRFAPVFEWKSFYEHFASDDEIVYGDSVWMPQNIRETGAWSYEIFIKQNINHQRIFYRKVLFDKYGMYKPQYKISGDHELNSRFFCNNAINKKYIPSIVASFHSGGLSSNKLDEVFWNDWDKIIRQNFIAHLPKKMVYGSLGNYIRYLVDKRHYRKALKLTAFHFYHTRSLGFLSLMLNYFISSIKNENRNSTLLAY